MARAKGAAKKTEGSETPSDGKAKKTTAKTLPKPVTGKQASRKLDQVSRQLEVSVEKLRGDLETVNDCLYVLLTAEAQRDAHRRFTKLAEGGVLHDLYTLAVALEQLGPQGLPPSLVSVHKYARLAADQIARAFEVRPHHKPGDSLTVTEDQRAAFDWSSDIAGEPTFPVQVTVLRGGWKAGSDVLVKPKVVRATV